MSRADTFDYMYVRTELREAGMVLLEVPLFLCGRVSVERSLLLSYLLRGSHSPINPDRICKVLPRLLGLLCTH